MDWMLVAFICFLLLIPAAFFVLVVIIESNHRWSHFRWHRKNIGGHWELWYTVEPPMTDVWYPVNRCWRDTGYKPNDLCLGDPIICEHWDPKAKVPLYSANKVGKLRWYLRI